MTNDESVNQCFKCNDLFNCLDLAIHQQQTNGNARLEDMITSHINWIKNEIYMHVLEVECTLNGPTHRVEEFFESEEYDTNTYCKICKETSDIINYIDVYINKAEDESLICDLKKLKLSRIDSWHIHSNYREKHSDEDNVTHIKLPNFNHFLLDIKGLI